MNRLPLALVASMLLLAALPTPLAQGKHGTTEQRTYVAASLVVFLQDCDGFIHLAVVELGYGVGGVTSCNVDDPPPAHVTIAIRDGVSWDVVLRVGAQVAFRNANGGTLSSDLICGGATLSVPDGTRKVDVFLGNPWGILAGCATAIHPGTIGIVTFAWSPDYRGDLRMLQERRRGSAAIADSSWASAVSSQQARRGENRAGIA